MIKLYKRGRIWWARGSFSGIKINRRSLETSDKKTAERMRAEIEWELLNGVQRVIWQDFKARFFRQHELSLAVNTVRKYDQVLSRFGRFLREANIVHVHQVDPGVVQRYVADRENDIHPTRGIPVGREGMKSDLRILRRVFNYALENGAIRKNPVRYRRLGSLPANTQPFSRAEIQAMLDSGQHDCTRPDMKTIILTFVCTGLRISDVMGLRKDDLRLDDSAIVVTTQKRKRTVSLPLHPDLEDALRKHLAAMAGPRKQSPLVFPTSTGGKTVSLDRYLRRFWARCGILNGRAHRFRDTFSVRMLETGASPYDVAQLMGISVDVFLRNYAPYVKELQERGRRLVMTMNPFGSVTP